MPKTSRRTLAGLAVVAAVLPGSLVLAGSGSAADAAAPLTTTLSAGQQLVAKTASDTLESSSHEYRLTVQPDSVALDQFAPLNGPNGPDSTGTGVWFRDDITGTYVSNTDHSILRMQTDGNLVLYTSTGHVLWASNTSGTGSHNRLVVQTDGNLVMYTSAGKAVWASGTTAVYLPAGRTLPSGKQMLWTWGSRVGDPTRQLVMRTNGDLAYFCGSRLEWHSLTYAAKSYAKMQTDGNLVVYSPAGRAMWSSGTAGHGPYTWLDASQLIVFVSGFKVLWRPNIPVGSC